MPGLQMVFDVLAIDGASGVFKRIGDSAGEAGAKVDAATTQVNNAGKKLEQGFALAGAAVAVVSVKMAADFQTSVTKLATTAGESTKNLKMVGDGMLSMAGQVGISANDLAKGMYIVESSGLHGTNALLALKAAAQGAKQEQADLGKTTDALTTILHDYNIPASQSADVMSKLVTAVSNGKTTLEDFTGSLHSVTPLAAALHVPLQDILGDLAAMTASGESADQATQNMADALRHMQAPTQPMIDELAQLGITASDLGAQLGTKGLAGTVQEISQAILQHMGPAGQVLLGTFNDSKVAAADAKQMFDNLPASVQKVAQGYIDGTLSLKDWRTQLKAMPADQAALAGQWKTMEDRAQGFNSALKSGKPDAQEYTAALQKAMGTSAGLTVALQLTGEHTDAVNRSIQNIAKSTGDASGNIKGWGEVQGNFNQQLAEAGAKVGAMAIQLGQNLLPALTSTLGVVNRDVLPGLEHLGSSAGSAAQWFSQLPGPVKDFALAMVALRVADAVGLLDRISTSAGGVANAVRTMGLEMSTAFSQAKAAQLETLTQSSRTFAVSGMGEVTAQSALAQSAVGRLSGNMAGLGAAMGQAASGGIAAAKSGVSGLVNLFGGPWGVAIGGAIAILPTLANGFELLTGHAIDATQATQSFTAALQASNGTIDQSVKRNIEQQLTQNGVIDTFRRAGISAQDAIAGIEGNRQAQERVTKALQDYITTSIATEGHNNANAQTAAKARDAYNQLTTAFGGSRQAADYFAGSVDDVGKQSTSASLYLQHLQQQIDSMHGKNIEITVSAQGGLATYTTDQRNLLYSGKAGGGPIFGPGTGTSDTAGLFALSNGEHVWTATEVAAAGGHTAVEALRKTVLAAGRGLAAGGAVGSVRVNVDIDERQVDSAVAALQKQMAANSPNIGSVAGGSSQQAVQIGAAMAAARGWTGYQWTDLFNLWMRESGWNPYAVNKSSGAYGIPQSLGHGHPYNLGDSGAQIAWGLNYIAGRYGSPAGAWAHEVSAGWYDNGGWLKPGLTMAYNGTGKPERIRTAEQESALGGGGPVIGMVVHGDVHADPDQLAYQARVNTQRALTQYGLSR